MQVALSELSGFKRTRRRRRKKRKMRKRNQEEEEEKEEESRKPHMKFGGKVVGEEEK